MAEASWLEQLPPRFAQGVAYQLHHTSNTCHPYTGCTDLCIWFVRMAHLTWLFTHYTVDGTVTGVRTRPSSLKGWPPNRLEYDSIILLVRMDFYRTGEPPIIPHPSVDGETCLRGTSCLDCRIHGRMLSCTLAGHWSCVPFSCRYAFSAGIFVLAGVLCVRPDCSGATRHFVSSVHLWDERGLVPPSGFEPELLAWEAGLLTC